MQDIVLTPLPESWLPINKQLVKTIVVSSEGTPILDIILTKELLPTTILVDKTTSLAPAEHTSPYTSMDVITKPGRLAQWMRVGKIPTSKFRIAPFREAIIVCITLFVALESVFLINAGNNLKNLVFAETFEGIDQLKQAQSTLSNAKLDDTITHFLNAKQSFLAARSQLNAINQGTNVVSGSLLTTSNQLLQVGEMIADIGNGLAQGTDMLIQTGNIKLALPQFKKVANSLRLASHTVDDMDISTIPTEYRDRIEQLKTELPQLNHYLDLFEQIAPALITIAGDEDTKRYLIILQNTTERRGTGGFMGSFIEVTFQNGKLLSAIPKDVYTVDWQQFNRMVAPEGLQPYMKGLALRDTNYNPDFYEASKDIRWAYGESKQGSIDGIIAIDQSITPALLALTGPVTLPDFNVTIDADNYFTVLQYYIETNKDDPETPKRILIQLINALFEKSKDPEIILKALQLVPTLIAEKHIQAAFFDDDIQKLASEFHIDGKLQPPTPNLDYLHINAINVGGNKGDRYLQRDYTHEATIADDGNVTIKLDGTWKHQWSSAEEDTIRALFPNVDKLARKVRENFWAVIGKSMTKHAVRFFVPKGSTLLSNTGFVYPLKTTEENGYQVWYSEVDVTIGGSTDFNIQYRLPDQLDLISGDNYRFLLQKQAGATQETLTHKVILDQQVQPIANYQGTSQGGQSLTTTTDLATDRYFELLVRRR